MENGMKIVATEVFDYGLRVGIRLADNRTIRLTAEDVARMIERKKRATEFAA